MGAAEVDKMADAGDSAVKPSRRFSTTLKSGAMKSYGCASGVCAGAAILSWTWTKTWT